MSSISPSQNGSSSSAPKKRVLVVGFGISGMASVIRLHRLGWEIVVVEKAAQRRKGGYTMWLFDAGKQSARRLGVLDDIPNRVHPNYHTYEIDRSGHQRRGFSFNDLPESPLMVLRGDIENGLYKNLPTGTDVRFSTVPVRIEQDVDGVDVTLQNTVSHAETTERFDLVIGADGMRSTVRRLVFGPDEAYMHPLGYMVGSCILSGPMPGYHTDEGLIMAEAGRSAWMFNYTNHDPTVLFSYKTDDIDAEFRVPPHEAMRRAFGPQPAGSVLGHLLDEYEKADEKLFDSTYQVKLNRWHQGRVVLLGDSAWCMTLYSGMGGAMGISGSELLGDMLEMYPENLKLALVKWEERLQPFIHELQKLALQTRVVFVPQNELQKVIRSTSLSLITSPLFLKATSALNLDFEQTAGAHALRDFDIVTRPLNKHY